MRLKKISISIILVLLMSALPLFGCSSGKSTSDSKDTTASDKTTTSVNTESSATIEESSTTTSGTDLPTFTQEELAKYDGKNGNPAYIAVDGTVYDVTNETPWKDGTHVGAYDAGKDLTSEFNSQSPHTTSIFDGVPVVGVYTG